MFSPLEPKWYVRDMSGTMHSRALRTVGRRIHMSQSQSWKIRAWKIDQICIWFVMKVFHISLTSAHTKFIIYQPFLELANLVQAPPCRVYVWAASQGLAWYPLCIVVQGPGMSGRNPSVQEKTRVILWRVNPLVYMMIVENYKCIISKYVPTWSFHADIQYTVGSSSIRGRVWEK